jgi:hypothetical protein
LTAFLQWLNLPTIQTAVNTSSPSKWLQTVPIEKAINEVGLFGNQNTVCKPITPKWRATVERLKQCFPHFDDS